MSFSDQPLPSHLYLHSRGFLDRIDGKSLGFYGNQTSYDFWSGQYVFEILAEKGNLKRVFLPEHGLFAELQDQIGLDDATIYKNLTNVEFLSLYGSEEISLFPDASKLFDIDLLIIDIQDVGSRYYTFLTSVAYILETIHRMDAGPEILVFDRPNPAGRKVEGTILERAYESFVGYPGVIHRHGMTAGELILYFAATIEDYILQTDDKYPIETGCVKDMVTIPQRNDSDREEVVFKIASWNKNKERKTNKSKGLQNIDIILFSIEGYLKNRSQINDFNSDSLAEKICWQICPSPNMPSPVTPSVYSGQCLLEGTNLSEGRGTTRPFEIFGAPFLPENLASFPVAEGAFLRPIRFIPTFHKHKDTLCYGYQIHVIGPYHSLLHTMDMLRFVIDHKQIPDFKWKTDVYEFRSDRPAIELLLGDKILLDYVRGSGSREKIKGTLGEQEAHWMRVVHAFLLYPWPLYRV